MAAILVAANGVFAASTVPDAPSVAPAPLVEQPLTPAANDAPGEQPSPQHTWVPGHWRWHEGAYVWESGRWEIPPLANYVWNAPQWQKQGSGYVLREGFWDEAPPSQSSTQTHLPPEQEILVSQPPPAPQEEVIHGRPTPTHVWVAGYWKWSGARYEWVPGHWTTPPQSNALWVPPRWEQRGTQHVFIPGYWRDAVMTATPAPAVAAQPQQQVVIAAPAPPPQQVVVVAAPPPPRREVVYVRPSPYHVWVPGYWAWRGGRHVWIAGHYATPPRGRRVWVEPRWERRGRGHVFIEGHWR